MEGKRDAIPNTEVVAMIEEHRKALGITPRKISDEEIVQRLVFSLVNEAAHILEGSEKHFQGKAMTSAVIVSTARTPLTKSWKCSFNMIHGATLGGHVVEHAISRTVGV